MGRGGSNHDHMNIQIFWQIVTVRNVPWAAVNLKGWHLGNPEKSIIGDQKSIISARLLDVCGVFYLTLRWADRRQKAVSHCQRQSKDNPS